MTKKSTATLMRMPVLLLGDSNSLFQNANLSTENEVSLAPKSIDDSQSDKLPPLQLQIVKFYFRITCQGSRS